MTTNKDVPIKFDGREDQRRFMVMEADEHFTRKESTLADEVFTKLYGYDANYHKSGVPFQDDTDLIAQFKHELFSRADIAEVDLRNFPKTAAYKRCFSLPRTTEATEVETILRSLAPFIKASLQEGKLVTTVGNQKLSDIIQYSGAIQYMSEFKEQCAFVAICRPLVFTDMQTQKPLAHSTVERGIYDCGPWLLAEYDLAVMPDMEPLLGGFAQVAGRYKNAPAAKFCIYEQKNRAVIKSLKPTYKPKVDNLIKARKGQCVRVNRNFKPDPNGCFETVNEMKAGVKDITGNKSSKVQYMDTLLFESDTPTKRQEMLEVEHAEKYKELYGEGAEIKATDLYKERLEYAGKVAMELFEKGIVARIVYSGAKSYHLLVRVTIEPKTLEEYKWLHSYLASTLTDKLVFDSSTSDPARLTRSPLTLERVSSAYGLIVTGEQHLVAEDWTHCYDLNWRPLYEQWQTRPLAPYERKYGKPLYPTKPEYLTALEALLDGSFWTSSMFDGNRQRLFFPVYRLLRALGYSSDEAWDTVIIPKLANYKKPDEIGYWKSRRNASLIKTIDAELDKYTEEWENK
jgi:hypothetical protein